MPLNYPPPLSVGGTLDVLLPKRIKHVYYYTYMIMSLEIISLSGQEMLLPLLA